MMHFAGIVVFLHGISLVFGDCGTVPDVDHATNNGSQSITHPEGTVVRYDCEVGYNLNSMSNIHTCTNSVWVGNVECQIVSCSYVATPSHGHITNEPDYTAGSKVKFGCDEGYELNGASSLLCRINGEWDPRTPGTCNVKVCPEFPAVTNGNINQNTANYKRNSYQSTLMLTCHSGYIKTGSAYVECGTDGQWVGTFSCEQNQCPEYPTTSSCIDTIEIDSSMYILTCKSGSNISVTKIGDLITDCYEGQWEHTNMACYCDCYVNTSPLLSANNLNGKSFLKHGEALVWSCAAGYRTNTLDTISCFDGKMTAQPSCEKIPTPKPTTITTIKKPGTNITSDEDAEQLKGLGTGEKVGIGVGVGAVIIALVTVVLMAKVILPKIRKSKSKNAGLNLQLNDRHVDEENPLKSENENTNNENES